MSQLIGIDPGLRSTGLVLVHADGPQLPRLLLNHTATTRQSDVAAPRDVARADRMLDAIWSWFETTAATQTIDAIAIERFDHRPWLTTRAGNARRVATSPEMGRLLGRLIERFTAAGLDLIEIAPDVSKAGWPSLEEHRRPLLPHRLKNRHERDAYLVAGAGAALLRRRIRTLNQEA